METGRPLPGIDDVSRPFWEAAKNGSLVVQRCQSCSYYNHPPRRECDRCLSANLRFEAVSGEGTIWTFTVMYQPSIPGFRDRIPYVNALVELDEQEMLLLLATLSGTALDDVRIGRRVRVTFERINDEIVLPQFELVGSEVRT